MIIVTTNGLPGYRIEHAFGEAFGPMVRPHRIGSNPSASVKTAAGARPPAPAH